MEKFAEILDSLKSFFTREWTTSEKILLVVDCILFGVVLGALWSPKKSKSAMIGCYNSNIEGLDDMEEDYE